MSFVDNIDKLHKKPDHIKRRILFIGVFVMMFIVVSVWISTLRVTLGDENKKENNISSPLSVFFGIIKESVSVGVKGIKDSIGNIKQDYGTKERE